MLAHRRAVGHVLHVLDRPRGAESHREDVEEVRRRAQELEDEGLRILGDDARQRMRLDVGGDRRRRPLDLREAVAVALHADDGAREVAGRRVRRDGIAEHLELEHEVGGRDRPSRSRVPLHPGAQLERVGLAVGADAVPLDGNCRCDVRHELDRIEEVRRVRIRHELARERALQQRGDRVVGAHGVEVEDVARPEQLERSALGRSCGLPAIAGARHACRRHQHRQRDRERSGRGNEAARAATAAWAPVQGRGSRRMPGHALSPVVDARILVHARNPSQADGYLTAASVLLLARRRRGGLTAKCVWLCSRASGPKVHRRG